MPKSYLGDGVYVDFDGWALMLTTDTNIIVLEPEVYASLVAYIADHLQKKEYFHAEKKE